MRYPSICYLTADYYCGLFLKKNKNSSVHILEKNKKLTQYIHKHIKFYLYVTFFRRRGSVNTRCKQFLQNYGLLLPWFFFVVGLHSCSLDPFAFLRDNQKDNDSRSDRSPVVEQNRYRNVGETCNTIESKYKPQDKTELSTLIQRDIVNQGNLVNLNYLDTSSITDMSGLFKDHKEFNGSIACWNVSKVVDMTRMFYGATLFNQNLDLWNSTISPSVSTEHMFTASGMTEMPNWPLCFDSSNPHVPANKDELETLLNTLVTESSPSPVLNHIETCNITDMSELFKDNTIFNGDISEWDMSKVTTIKKMFERASSFNGDISGWDVSKVVDMSEAFAGATKFNGDISEWNVNAVTDMNAMFNGASAFSQNLDPWNTTIHTEVTTEHTFVDSAVTVLPQWDICYHPTNGDHIVADKEELSEKINAAMLDIGDSPNLNNIETCNITDMSELFKLYATFNGDITEWDVSNVTTMRWMFAGASVFNQDIGSWDVSNVKDMDHMFMYTSAFNQYIGEWNVSNVVYMQGMFRNTSAFNRDIGDWNVESVIDMSSMFNAAKAFNQNISGWNLESVQKIDYMFSETDAFNQNIAPWNVSNILTMSYMFNGATAFNQDISAWDISSVSDMKKMFKDAKTFCADLSAWEPKLKEGLVTTDMFVETGTECDVTFVAPSWY